MLPDFKKTPGIAVNLDAASVKGRTEIEDALLVYQCHCEKWDKKFLANELQAGDLSKFLCAIRDLARYVNSSGPYGYTVLSNKYNESVRNFRKAVASKAKPVFMAIARGANLLEELRPHFNLNDATRMPDDADVIFGAVLGGRTRYLGAGRGECFSPTPLRHLEEVFERMQLTADDVVLDLGGGIGLPAAFGTHCAQSRFICGELDTGLFRKADHITRLGSRGSRATALKMNILKDDFGEANKFFCYEAVHGEKDAAALVRKVAQHADGREVLVGCYSIPGQFQTVQNAFRNSFMFQEEVQYDREDIAIFRSCRMNF